MIRKISCIRGAPGRSRALSTDRKLDTRRTQSLWQGISRVVGFITGQEPPEERAIMWVDLLLAPSGKASLLGVPAWLTNDFIGYDALKKGMNADALEGMCAVATARGGRDAPWALSATRVPLRKAGSLFGLGDALAASRGGTCRATVAEAR